MKHRFRLLHELENYLAAPAVVRHVGKHRRPLLHSRGRVGAGVTAQRSEPRSTRCCGRAAARHRVAQET